MIVLREFVNYRGTIVIVLLLPIVIRNDDQSCLDCLCSHWSPRGPAGGRGGGSGQIIVPVLPVLPLPW